MNLWGALRSTCSLLPCPGQKAEVRVGRATPGTRFHLFHQPAQDLAPGHPRGGQNNNGGDDGGIGYHLLTVRGVPGPALSTLEAQRG